MNELWDFSGCPVVKKSALQCRGHGSIPGWGTKIPEVTLKLSLRATTPEPVCSRACTLQPESLRASAKAQCSPKINKIMLKNKNINVNKQKQCSICEA